MIPPIHLQNIDGISLDTPAPTLSTSYRKSPTTLPSTLFRLDPPLLDYKKTDEKPVGKFL